MTYICSGKKPSLLHLELSTAYNPYVATSCSVFRTPRFGERCSAPVRVLVVKMVASICHLEGRIGCCYVTGLRRSTDHPDGSRPRRSWSFATDSTEPTRASIELSTLRTHARMHETRLKTNSGKAAPKSETISILDSGLTFSPPRDAALR